MKFTIDMKAFRAALALAAKVVPAKSPISIALCVKIVTNDSRITVTGTNFDLSFEAQVPAEVATEGATCINFATLSAFCAAAKADTLIVEADKAQVIIRAGKSRITVLPLDPADFPNYLPAEGDLTPVDDPTFCRALRFCNEASSDEEVRYYLRGPFVEESTGGLDLWATDGHSMHHASLPDHPPVGGGGIVPSEAATIICGIGEKADTFAVMISDRGWHVQAGAIRAWGKAIDGTFPDVRRAAGAFEWTDILAAPRDELSAAMTVAACGADTTDKARQIIIAATADAPAVIRGARGMGGVLRAGRAETETRAMADGLCAVSAELISRAISAMSGDDLVLSTSGSAALRLRPAQGSAVMVMEAIVMGMRAREDELKDVADAA